MNIEIRKLTIADYNDLRESMVQAYDASGNGIWSKAVSYTHLDVYKRQAAKFTPNP